MPMANCSKVCTSFNRFLFRQKATLQLPDSLLLGSSSAPCSVKFVIHHCFVAHKYRAPSTVQRRSQSEGLPCTLHHHLEKSSSPRIISRRFSGTILSSMDQTESREGRAQKNGPIHVLTASPSVVGPAWGRLAEKLADAGFTVHKLWEQADADTFFANDGDQIKVVVPGHEGVDGGMMDRLPNLEIIANFGVGYDSIDIDAAKDRGIRVTNTPDVLSDDVADLALALMLGVSRRITLADRYVREGKWEEGNFPIQRKVSGKKVGILGLGRIGQAIASRASAFNMKVAYHGRHEKSGVPYEYHSSLVDLAKACDFLVIACPGGASTRHLVNRNVLEALGPKGCLVNIARGSVVEESELVKALAEGRLGSAGLDVFEDEPRVPEELKKMDNVVLQPHMGSATFETRNDMADLVVANLTAHFTGKELPTPVA